MATLPRNFDIAGTAYTFTLRGYMLAVVTSRVEHSLSDAKHEIEGEGYNSPTFEQLTRFNKRMPVLVYEKIRTGRFLLVNRYRDKLVFVGRVNVIGLLLLGLTGYWYLNGTRYHGIVLEGLLGIMTTAKLDDRIYRVTDWCQKRGRLLVYVTREAPKASLRTKEA
jgi:hypothetical protein